MAQKKLSERIAERAQRQEGGGRKQQYQAIFLSLRDEIDEASKAGWKVRTIWETLHLEKKFDGTYECFLSYFNKIIRDKTSPEAEWKKTTAKELPAVKEAGRIGRSEAVATTQETIPQFMHPDTFDPKELMGE